MLVPVAEVSKFVIAPGVKYRVVAVLGYGHVNVMLDRDCVSKPNARIFVERWRWRYRAVRCVRERQSTNPVARWGCVRIFPSAGGVSGAFLPRFTILRPRQRFNCDEQCCVEAKGQLHSLTYLQ